LVSYFEERIEMEVAENKVVIVNLKGDMWWLWAKHDMYGKL